MEFNGQVYIPTALSLGKNTGYPLNKRPGSPKALLDVVEKSPCPCRESILSVLSSL
jgi:hypothetical protein